MLRVSHRWMREFTIISIQTNCACQSHHSLCCLIKFTWSMSFSLTWIYCHKIRLLLIKWNKNQRWFRVRWINEEEIVKKKSYLYLFALKQASKRESKQAREERFIPAMIHAVYPLIENWWKGLSCLRAKIFFSSTIF